MTYCPDAKLFGPPVQVVKRLSSDDADDPVENSEDDGHQKEANQSLSEVLYLPFIGP